MEIGVIETSVETTDEKRKPRNRPSRVGGGPGGGRGPGGNGGGGGDDQKIDPFKSLGPREPTVDKSRIITIFLLIIVGMTFAGLFGAYLFIASNRALEWASFKPPLQLWFSTAFIILSSVAYAFAERAISNDSLESAKRWLFFATGFGATFISSQIFVWYGLVQKGFYMRGNPYAGFFYILTAVHLVHVVGGMTALGIVLSGVLRRLDSSQAGERLKSIANAVGRYWHFMAILWLVVVGLLAFWR